MAQLGSAPDKIYVAVTQDGELIMATTSRVVADRWVGERYKVVILDNKKS